MPRKYASSIACRCVLGSWSSASVCTTSSAILVLHDPKRYAIHSCPTADPEARCRNLLPTRLQVLEHASHQQNFTFPWKQVYLQRDVSTPLDCECCPILDRFLNAVDAPHITLLHPVIVSFV